MSQKEKKKSEGEIARQSILALYTDSSDTVLLVLKIKHPEKTATTAYAAVKQDQIDIYEFNKSLETKVIKIDSLTFSDWSHVSIDHYFLKSVFEFTTQGNRKVITTEDKGKELVQIIKNTSLEVTVVPRSWKNKILGFRSRTMWKMVTASIIYVTVLVKIISSFSGTSDTATQAPAQETQTSSQSTQTNSAEEKKKADAEAKQQAQEEAAKKKQLQQSVLQFEQKLYAIEKPATAAGDVYKKTADKMANGQATVFDLYAAATDAKNQAENVQVELAGVSVPDGLPSDVEDLLDESKQKLSTAYYSKKQAMDHAMKFLDEQKPSELQKAKEESQMAQSFIMDGVVKMMEAKEKMGIPIADPNKK